MSQYDKHIRNTWLEVDLGQFRRNIEIIQKTAETRVLVIVKSNAYGHGLERCGIAAQEAGAEMLGVATCGEGALLREAGVTIPLLRVTAYGMNEIEPMIADDTHFIIWTAEQVKTANEIAGKLNKTAKVHLKIDTGMGRAGVFAEDVAPIAQDIDTAEHIDMVGVCSHFHSAEAAPESSIEQMKKFDQALDTLAGMNIKPDYIHLANSRGLLKFPQARYNMVRSGVVTYGLPYDASFPLPDGMAAIAQWKARVLSVRTFPKNHVISYGGQYKTQKDGERIAIIPLGYVDGFQRFPAEVNEVLIRGRKLKTVGRICMDQCHVTIPDDMDVREGEEVVVLGTQGDAEITSVDIGNRWGTNKYDVLCGISARVPRLYS